MSGSTSRPPVISEKLLSIPEQRLYVLSAGALVQSLKLLDLFSAVTANDVPSWRLLFYKWCLVDAVTLWLASELRIPRLSFNKRARVMYILVFAIFNWILFGTYSISFASLSPTSIFRWSERQLSLSERRVNVEDVINGGRHLIGQHTVRLSPTATATLNPFLQSFCLSVPGYAVFIPVLFNNSRPKSLQYAMYPLAAPNDATNSALVELSAKDLKVFDQAYTKDHQAPSVPLTDDDDDDDDDTPLTDSGVPRLGKNEVLHYIKITRPGIVRLERASEANDLDIRLRQNPGSVTVVDCPHVQFTDKTYDETRCVGAAEELKLTVFGVPPLALTWTREVQGRRDEFIVEGIEGGEVNDISGSGARTIQIPLGVELDKLGRHTYTLESVSDAHGNSVSLSSNRKTQRIFTVLRRPEVSFANCAAGKPVPLRKGASTHLRLRTHASDDKDAPWDIAITGPKDEQRRSVRMKSNAALDLEVREPGEYTIVDVKGQYCLGDVLTPETCRVAEVPVPSARATWEKIRECSGDTGVEASLVLHGTPPFVVEWTEQHNGGPVSHRRRTLDASRGSFTLQPPKGTYKYAFSKLSDANYQDIPLHGPTVELSVHPSASARLTRKVKKDEEVYSCAGNELEIGVELQGSAPWTLEVQVGSKTLPFRNIREAQTRLKVPIPKDIDSEGGAFQVDLVSIEDAQGCKKPVSEQGMTVKVKRIKPTVKFYTKDGKRQVTVHQGETASLPLRLTGDGPWKVQYRHQDRLLNATIAATNANGELRVKDSGLFELIEVHDKHCPGTIISGEETYNVFWVPRPTIKLASSTEVEYIASNDSFVRPPVCEGVPDYVDLELDGHAPFKIKYNVAREDIYGTVRLIADESTVGSIQKSMRFTLDTATPGRLFYEVRDIGDARYPLHIDPSPSAQSRLQFEQQVLVRPAAWFKNAERMSFCLGDTLEPLAGTYKDDGVVVLRGAPPFTLDITVRNLATSEMRRETVRVDDHVWRLAIPGYSFTSVGQHLVEINSVLDANGCEHTDAMLDAGGSRSAWIDVAETAAIVPYDRRIDYCVGDVLQFQLEGTPPWRVKYTFKERTTTATVKTSQFRRVAGTPGVFSVVSIAHQRNMCQTPVNDLQMNIHDIPSAQVSHGKKVIEDIREGEQAEIVFTLIGDPPFTFTYQRAELPTRGRTPKILETHTVSGVMTNEYSIFSALEGTWTVTFISDKWCRYPPAQVDASVEKA